MIEIHDFRFQMHMSCLHDSWLPTGIVFNHPRFADGDNVHTSTPVAFNRDTMTFKTVSGSEYKIVSFLNEEKAIRDLEEAIREYHERLPSLDK